MRTVTIIPARGGSKGIPKKNLQKVGHQTLISRTLLHAVGCQHLDDIYVSTEDSGIAEEVRRFHNSTHGIHPIKVIDRPPKLATDEATTESAIEHVLTQTERPDLILLLQCTSPFRSVGQLDDAITKFNKVKYDCMVAVAPFHGYLWGKNKKKEWTKFYGERRRRQDMDKEYFVETGSFYLFPIETFEKHGNRIGDRPQCYVVPDCDALEIDTLWDLDLARAVWHVRNE